MQYTIQPAVVASYLSKNAYLKKSYNDLKLFEVNNNKVESIYTHEKGKIHVFSTHPIWKLEDNQWVLINDKEDIELVENIFMVKNTIETAVNFIGYCYHDYTESTLELICVSDLEDF